MSRIYASATILTCLIGGVSFAAPIRVLSASVSPYQLLGEQVTEIRITTKAGETHIAPSPSVNLKSVSYKVWNIDRDFTSEGEAADFVLGNFCSASIFEDTELGLCSNNDCVGLGKGTYHEKPRSLTYYIRDLELPGLPVPVQKIINCTRD